MSEVWFYQLTDTPLEVALAPMLAMSIDRGWSVRVRGSSPERLDHLDRYLWTHDEQSFLPHGRAGGAHDAAQPILLTHADENANNAQCLMFIDGAMEATDQFADYDRVCVIFDGNDADATNTAREQWKNIRDAGFTGKYWAQENRRWIQKS